MHVCAHRCVCDVYMGCVHAQVCVVCDVHVCVHGCVQAHVCAHMCVHEGVHM